ncbi:MAG: hypothetical protein IKD04_01805 [Clostridia bacterium]|nr:hypothetical protein [Clostridia bacterium]
MKKVFLDKAWVLRGERIGELPASVPGCVHTDLMANGIIKDLYWRDNNRQYTWIEDSDFTYSCRFDAEAADFAQLVFEGLDTYCDVFLNGEKVGSADDMFIEYRFDVGGKLKHKDNLLELKFRSAVKEVEGLPWFDAAFTAERLWTRRIQCTYGWDWVDRFVTCGIYRPVYIEYGNDFKVDSAYIYTESIDKYSAQLYLELEFQNYTRGELVNVEIISPSGKPVAGTSLFVKEPKAVRRFDISEPLLWYPAGYGEQPLYTLRVTAGENVLSQSFGIRTVKILQLTDAENSQSYQLCKKLQERKHGDIEDKNTVFSGFMLLINGKKIFCNGANWVPSEPFPSAETAERFENFIALAKEMGLNMLRVWGGGIFEDSKFYDCCDRAGILVTQDFLMACGAYPEKEAWFIDKLKQEAEYAVKLLRNHPCLVWWSGDNENATLGSDTMEDYRGRASALSGIAPSIYKYDWSRQFLPSSPYGGDTYASFTKGTTHNTNFLGDIFNYFDNADCADYKEYLGQFLARFIAEEPTFGAVSRKSALKFMTEADLADEKQEMLLYHTKTNPGLGKEVFTYITTFALKVLGEAQNSADRYFKYKYIQYEWVRVVFENIRRNIGFCNGLVFWMFGDCWPAALGWSFVDYYCMPKASFYAFRRCAAKATVSVIKNGDGYEAVVSNSLESSIPVKAHAYLLKRSGGFNVCEATEFELLCDEYSSKSYKLPWKTDEDNLVICCIDANGACDSSFYKDGKLEITDCTADLKPVSRTEESVTLSTDRYIHAVELEGDYIFSENYFSLLPGEEKTVTFKRLATFEDSEIAITAYTLK